MTKGWFDKARHRTVLLARAELRNKFPKCFMEFGAPKLPLKIGIDRDLLAVADGAYHFQHMQWALLDYTQGDSYLAGLTAGAVRVDLDGNPAGTVLEVHARYAAAVLAKRKRRAAQEQRQRAKATGKAPIKVKAPVAAPKPATRRTVQVEVVRRRSAIKGIARTGVKIA
jgi:ProP effector